jgi:hypothetical protein
MEVSFEVEEVVLLPKNLLINLLPPCFIIVVPEIEDDLGGGAIGSLASLIPTGAITPNILPTFACTSLSDVRMGLLKLKVERQSRWWPGTSLGRIVYVETVTHRFGVVSATKTSRSTEAVIEGTYTLMHKEYTIHRSIL